METILTCAACRHIERGDTRNALMLKVRMWNHINQNHPALIERFREVVHSEVMTAEESAAR